MLWNSYALLDFFFFLVKIKKKKTLIIALDEYLPEEQAGFWQQISTHNKIGYN